nr:hypothetical protein [Tanacetum cinerariifolium]
MATLPFVTSFVSATPKQESGVLVDSVTGLNLQTIGPSERCVIYSDSSHHSSTNASGAEDNYIIRSAVIPPVMIEVVVATHVASIPYTLAPEPSTKVVTPVHASKFQDSDFTGTMRLDVAGSSHVPRKELSMGSQEVYSKSLYEVFVPRRNISNDSLLDNFDASREFIDHLAPPILFYYVNERRRLESNCKKHADLLRARDDEIEGLKAQLLLKEAEAAKAIRLRAEVSKYEAVEKSIWDEMDVVKERNIILEKEQNALDVKVTDLEASAKGKECELIDLNSLLNSVKSQNDVLVDQVHKLEVSFSRLQEKVTVYENHMEQLERFQDDRIKTINDKFDQFYTDFVEIALHLEEKFYPHLLITISGPAISKAIEKEADYTSALQMLQSVNFSLLANLRSNKDSSIETIMNILCLEELLAERLGLTEMQPSVDQLMVPIHYSPDRVVVGATALSLSLDVSRLHEMAMAAFESQYIETHVNGIFKVPKDPFNRSEMFLSRARFVPRKSFATLADHLHEAMVESLPTMVEKHVKEKVQKQVPEQKTSEYEAYDFWTESYASDDDEIPTKQMSQDIMEEVSLTIDEAS